MPQRKARGLQTDPSRPPGWLQATREATTATTAVVLCCGIPAYPQGEVYVCMYVWSSHIACMYVCFVFSSHPFWTSSSLDVPAGVTQEEGHTGFLIHLPSAVRALIFVARRIQPFLSLVDREVEFCVLTN